MLFFAEVHPFRSVTAEPVTVDIVSPEDAPPPPKIEEKEEPVPELKPSSAFDLPAQAASANSPPAAPQSSPPAQATAAPKPQPPRPQSQQAALTSQPPATQPAAAAQPPTPASAAPGYAPPEPDLSLKYHVLLGLPPALPVGQADAGDAEASDTADLVSSLVTEFRRHLKTCLKLPPSVSPSDHIRVKLRVPMTPDGRLAGAPVAIEGSASMKAFDLKQSAVDALQACQPYTMLPADRYGEWKVLDLNFTPQDFAGG